MVRRLIMCAVLLFAISASAGAWIENVGEPVEGGSWSQQFRVYDVTFNYLQAKMFTTGDFFEAPVFSGFSKSGWTWGPAAPNGTFMLAAWAMGPTVASTQDLYFYLKFAGDRSNQFGFTFQIGELLPSGWTLKETYDAKWTGSGWDITEGNSANLTMPIIPEASTLMLALAGLSSIAGFRRLRRI